MHFVGTAFGRPPQPNQPLRLMATGAPSPSSLPDFLLTSQPAAAARKRGQSAAPPAPALRYGLPGSVSRNGGLGESRHGGTGGCAAGPIAASPSDPLVPFPSLGKVHPRKRKFPPPRKDRALSCPGLSSKSEEAKRSFAQSSFAHFSFKKSGCGKSGGKCVFFPEGVFFFEGICAILTEICVFLNRRSYIERHPLNHPVSQRQPQDL